MTIHCPSDTRDLVSRTQISNFALYYRYFLDEIGGKFGLRAQRPDNALNFADPKKVFTGRNSVLAHLRNRQIDQLRYIASSGQWLAPGHFYCATARLDWRLVVGLGAEHVQETNMTLDHVYGIPYLPGSAFKGVLRSWIIQTHFGNNEKLATRDIEVGDSAYLKQKKKDFFAVFGSQKAAGKVHFLDVLPNSNVHFELDIINPHFSDYYKGNTFPTDDQELIQVYFLTLKNTYFRFLMHAETAGPLQLAKDWFTQAITNLGFGAKSAVGYGYFRKLEEKTDAIKEEFAEQLSLDDAYDIYRNHPDLKESIHIDIEQLVSYAPKFAIIVAEDICEIEKIGGVNEISESLIEAEVGMVVPSEFGKWVWEKTKDKLFEEALPAFPNLVYRSAFRRALGNLPPDQRKLLQEKLLQIAIDFRQTRNSNLSPTDRELLEEKLLQIAEDLEKGGVFVNLSPADRDSLKEKLLQFAENLGMEEYSPELVDVEGGRTIVCGGVENGNLVLRSYTNQ